MKIEELGQGVHVAFKHPKFAAIGGTMQEFLHEGKMIEKKGGAALPSQAVDAVGRKLKASYDQMLREPIPEKLLQLLDKLDRSDPEVDAGHRSGTDATSRGEE